MFTKNNVAMSDYLVYVQRGRKKKKAIAGHLQKSDENVKLNTYKYNT